jgi:uncharacterized metal-binding protein YceD (DUF177 family)
MRFRLHKLLDAPVGTRQHERIDRATTWLDDELKLTFLRGDVTFTRGGDRIIVEGSFETATTVQCVRSLEMFEMALQFNLEDAAFRLPGFHVPGEPELRKLAGDLWVDLTENIREGVVMAIPMNPVHPDYQDPDALSRLVNADEQDWLTVKWASKDDDQ